MKPRLTLGERQVLRLRLLAPGGYQMTVGATARRLGLSEGAVRGMEERARVKAKGRG